MKSKYEEGQVWKYKARDNEKNSTITILKVEDNVIRIRINGINVVSKANLAMNELRHAPIDIKSLDASVMEYAGLSKQALDLSGYEAWKKAKGGVFTITVSEIVDLIQKAVLS